MMHEIVIGGIPHGIRCDMNVIEEIEDHFGSIDGITEKRTIKAAKFLAAAMINEQNYFAHSPERVTPEWVGAQMMPTEYAAAWQGLIQCFVDSINVKKK